MAEERALEAGIRGQKMKRVGQKYVSRQDMKHESGHGLKTRLREERGQLLSFGRRDDRDNNMQNFEADLLGFTCPIENQIPGR